MSTPTIRSPQVDSAAAAAAVTRSGRARVPSLHLGLAALMTLIVLLGFWPFYSGLFTGAARAHALIYAHAAVFSGWMVLLIAQTWLVIRRRVSTHQRLGRLGILYGGILLLSGTVTAFAAPALNVRNGTMTMDEAAGFLILPIGDMLLFGGFFVAGILARRRPQAHRRLMILAAVALIFPAAARFAFPAGMLGVLTLWLLPLLIAIGHDFWTAGRVHRLYWAGLAICLIAASRVALMESEPWHVVGRSILRLMLPAGT